MPCKKTFVYVHGGRESKPRSKKKKLSSFSVCICVCAWRQSKLRSKKKKLSSFSVCEIFIRYAVLVNRERAIASLSGLHSRFCRLQYSARKAAEWSLGKRLREG